MTKKLLWLFPVIVLGFFIFTGQDNPVRDIEKWNITPDMTGIQMTGETYTPLPTLPNDFVFTTTPRVVNTRGGSLVVNPSFRPYPTTNTTQSEVVIVRNPTNPAIMWASANMYYPTGGFISEGVYVTTNGGANWFGNDTLTGAPISGHSGDPGPTIDKDGVFLITHLGGGIGANFSTNNGLTWSNTFNIITGSQDKNLSNTDDVPGSPFYGRSYTVWTDFRTTVKPIMVSYTTNNGTSWSTAQAINNPPSPLTTSQGCDVVVGPGGVVYATWRDHGASPFTGVRVGLGVSTNGGVNWTVTDQAFAMNGVRSTSFGTYGIRVPDFPRIDVDKSGGPRNGWIYIITNEFNLAPAGTDADIIMNISSDGGATWTRSRVNQDPLNNGKLQFFGAVDVDDNGGVNVVYYSNENTASDSAEVFVGRSIDGGATWDNIIASDHHFRPRAISGLAGGYQGDYIGITTANNKIWPVWMDNSTGIYQLWTASIELGPAISHTPLTNTENTAGPYVVNCTITPAGSPISAPDTKVFWSRNGGPLTNSVTMTNSSGNNWTANIPGNGTAAEYRYYISTKDNLNRTSTHPGGAPGNFHSFMASPDTQAPNITHTPVGPIPLINWPASVSATVTDNIGVDSVFVKWKKNSNGSTNTFTLANVGGDNYEGTFNSTPPSVNLTDTIYYRVFANDISSNHNLDSTSQHAITFLNKFFIEPFPTTTFNTAHWATITDVQIIDASGVATGTFPHPIPSSPFFLTVKNTAALLESQTIDLSSFNTAALIMKESEHDLEIGERVHLEYWDGAAWQSLHIFNGTDNGFGVFEPFDSVSFILPGAALNSTFKFRYRGEGLESTDEWFFDDICILGDVQTGLTVNQGIPEKFGLNQNYPNPFNPSTKISFDIPKQSHVSIKIYDITGREIAKLINQQFSAGSYTVDFNGAKFASGVYFYRLEADGFVETKRMMLIK
ncbi:MAG: T9SS type A sorting domain-containing protein [Ignavibacteriae bacterium]|nr:T9SS type A sorting domain-containing protein [Ignavibacteriota bacterium]MCB9242873.1 T9SS type A sorting domain-containing protein [Ignavibacteriales bacterium]